MYLDEVTPIEYYSGIYAEEQQNTCYSARDQSKKERKIYEQRT